MLSLDIEYISINIFLLFLFAYSGNQIAKGNSYLFYSTLCVVSFTIVLGLRYARGNDYMHYVDLYTFGYDEGRQLVFTWINGMLKWFRVGKYHIFLFYSLIEIICAVIFLRKYRKYGDYIFPLFLIATIIFDEYQIRQALGFAFGFLCMDLAFRISSYNDIFLSKNINKIIGAIVCFSISYSIHSVCGYMLIIIIGVHFLLRKAVPIYISIPALIFSVYFFSGWFDFSWLNPVLNTVAGNDERMSEYIEDSYKWFTEDAMKEQYIRNPIVLVFEICGTISLYYFGSRIVNINKKQDSITFYNIFVIGTILLNAFRTLELLNRIGRDFALFWFFPLSVILYYRKNIIKTKMDKLLSTFLLWWVYDYLKYLFMRGDMTMFLWDK